MTNGSQAFFPLRSNADYFSSPEAELALEQRIKQASILYDRIILEGGIYKALIGDDGAWDLHVPRSKITGDMLRPERDEEHSDGRSLAVWANIPNTEPRLLVSSNITHELFCQYETLIQKAHLYGVDWLDIEEYQLTPSGKRIAHSAEGLIKEHFELGKPSEGRFLRSRISSNLSHDLVMSQDMSCTISINMASANELLPTLGLAPATGWAGLQATLPNIGNIGWEEIAQERKSPSYMEFRKKLVQIETVVRGALDAGDIDTAQYEISLGQKVIDELTEEMKGKTQTSGKIVRNALPGIVLDIVSSFGIPLPFISTAISSLKEFAEMQKQRHSWTATYFRLRR